MNRFEIWAFYNKLWRINKVALSNINDLELESLLLTEDLSEEEKKKQKSLIAEYLERDDYSHTVDISSLDREVEIIIDDSFVDDKELDIDKITNEELFDILREEPVEVDPEIMFPRIEQINKLFWFLRKLANQDIKKSKVKIKNQEELSLKFYILLEATIFFGFIETTVDDGVLYLAPTEMYNDSMDQTIEQQYLIFLKALASNESISESLIIQLNDPIFDRISKQMIHNVLAVDSNIQNEEITNEDIEEITNDLRYWYLGIRNTVLKS